jgi:hypothetical protein
MLSVCPSINFWMAEPIFMKIGVYVTAPEPNSSAYFISLSHQPVYLYVYLPVVARQRLGKNVTAITNTYATTEELLDISFYLRSVSY